MRCPPQHTVIRIAAVLVCLLGWAGAQSGGGSRLAISGVPAIAYTGASVGAVTVTVTSPALAKVAPGTLTAHRPRIAGKHKVGRRVHAVSGPWTQTAVTVTYRWYRSGHLIHGATKAGYKLRAADRHRRISVKVVAKAAGYHPYKKRSAATKPIR